MSALFEAYKIALLDSSFFMTPFSDAVRDSLTRVKVYAADTFNSEIEEYRKILSPNRQKLYDANVRFLSENIRINTLNLDTFGAESEHLQNDTWGIVSLLVNFHARFVILTGNQLLIQRIVMNGLPVDIYDLSSDSFIFASAFSSLKGRYSLSNAKWIDEPEDINTGENSVLYDQKGQSVRLGSEIRSGLEATLYRAKGEPDTIAKIFKKDKLSADKFQNIKALVAMKEKPDTDWAVFPENVLYYDADLSKPAGFTEHFVNAGGNLDGNPLFLGDPFNVPDEYLEKKQSYAIEICLKIVRQVCYLNTLGFFISDYNLGNFAPSLTDGNRMQMWDTDSFGYGSYFGKFFSPDYVESSLHTPYDIKTKEGAVSICNDALYQFVFMILSLGDSPISERKKSFKYDNPSYFAQFKRKFFPKSLWNHMEEVFRGTKPPSAEALMHRLLYTLRMLKENPNADKTFRQLFIEAIPGYEETLRQMEEEKEKAKRAESEQSANADSGSQNFNNCASGSGFYQNASGYGSSGQAYGSSPAGAYGTASGQGSTDTYSQKTAFGTMNVSGSNENPSGEGQSTNNPAGKKKKSKGKIIFIILLIAILAFFASFFLTEVYGATSLAELDAATAGTYDSPCSYDPDQTWTDCVSQEYSYWE
ncbi:MAG: hypothetical protein U0L49_00340 [Eubacterium sp.]|nr:hypothetical protein [Eubacterium sp.]